MKLSRRSPIWGSGVKEIMHKPTALMSTNHMIIVPVIIITSRATGEADPVSMITSGATEAADPAIMITSRATGEADPIGTITSRATARDSTSRATMEVVRIVKRVIEALVI